MKKGQKKVDKLWKAEGGRVAYDLVASIVLSGSPLSNQTIYKVSCRGGRPRLYMAPRGKDRKLQYKLEARSQYKGELLEGDLKMEVGLFFKDARRRDIDNFNKLTLDSLEGILYSDDKQIIELIVKKQIDRKNPRVEILVRDINSERALLG